MKRILICITTYLPSIGGAELATQAIMKHLPGYVFDVVTSRYDAAHRCFDATLPEQEIMDNATIYRVGGRMTFATLLVPKILLPLAIARRALRLQRAHPYDVILAVQASQAAGGAWLFSLFNPRVPFILNIQEGNDLMRQSFLKRWFRKILLRRARIVTVLSTYLGNIVRNAGVPSQHIQHIPQGVDSTLLAPSINSGAERTFIRQTHHISSTETVIISVSRLVGKNGIDILLRAFAALNVKPMRLLLIGDGPERAYLESLAYKLGCATRVVFLGSILPRDVTRYLHAADIFVRPSRSEGFGIAFLEAMAARVPVIATNVGGIPDFVHDGETGLLCAPNSPIAVATAIERLARDTALREHISANAARIVVERYTWDIVASQYRKLFETVMS